MTALLALITSPLGRKVAGGLAALLALLAAWAVVARHYEARGAAQERARTARVQTDLDSCHVSFASAQTALRDTQVAMANLEAESDRRAADAAKARQAGEAAISAAGKTATAIMALKPDGDVCRAAHKLATEG